MRRALLVIATLAAMAVFAWIVLDVLTTQGWKRAGSRPWPEGLGALEEVDARYPKRSDSAAATRLAELARPLGLEFVTKEQVRDKPAFLAIANYVDAQQRKDVAVIDEPPPVVASYLAQHAQELDAIREHLLAHGPEIQWRIDFSKGLDAPTPNFLAHLQLGRLLVARALVLARRNDPAAWQELHAAWELGRALNASPEEISSLIAMATVRSVNAAAWKCPLPAPDWMQIDVRRSVLTGMRNGTWLMWRYATLTSALRFYERAALAGYANHERETARLQAAMTNCRMDVAAFNAQRRDAYPGWNKIGQVLSASTQWDRVLRFQAEREATANALRIRAGQPIVARSQCADGAWSYANGTLAFNIDLPARDPKKSAMPLTLRQLRGTGSETLPVQPARTPALRSP